MSKQFSAHLNQLHEMLRYVRECTPKEVCKNNLSDLNGCEEHLPRFAPRSHSNLSYSRKLPKGGFQEADLYQIELAIGEAVVNIIHYAYEDEDGYIEIDCGHCKESFTVIISDRGAPFNPLNVGKILDVQPNIENVSIGGYGIFFILKAMDEVKYSREDGKNILTLVKYYKQ
jgi:serine/threonine-protein kinase RsbW